MRLVRLADGWAFWEDFAVRGAGFPARDVLALATPDLPRAADALLAATTDEAAARARAIASCEHARDSGPRDEQKAYSTAIRQLRSGSPAPFAMAPAVAAAIAELAQATETRGACAAAYEQALAASLADCGGALRRFAEDPRFREAVGWQNRGALHTALAPLLRQAGDLDREDRRHQRLVASYLQRYCVKNDTIGFFGPVGWARFGASSVQRPRPGLVTDRRVALEYWAIARLARQLASDPRLRPTLAPRRAPSVWIAGTVLHHPVARTTELPPAYARLIAACEGERTARAIAEELVAEPENELESSDEVYDMLDELVGKGLVTWTVELPTAGSPEQHLRDVLARAETEIREEGLGWLARLETGRAAVAGTAGDPEALDRALGELEVTFSELTGAAATRNSGQTYGARTLVYEDCLRNTEVELAETAFGRAASALALVLTCARWYTHEIAARYRALCDEAYAGLCRDGHGPAVDYIQFWQRIEHAFTGDMRLAAPLVGEISAEVQRRWLAALGPFDPATACVTRTSHEVAAVVAEQFAAPGPGYPTARFHSPDIMFAARELEELGRDAAIVLGEIHVGVNTLMNPVLARFHARPEALLAAMQRDLGASRVTSAGTAEQMSRVDFGVLLPHDLDLEVGATRSSRARAQVIAIGTLVVEPAADAPGAPLIVRTRDGRHRFDVIEFLDAAVAREAMSHFQLIPAMPHTPRIVIDRLVVSRERWSMPGSELAFAHAKQPAQRFLAARGWARARGLPRLVFVKVPEEPKPCFIDFDSPIYVETLCTLGRKASRASFSEMLPSIDETWLADADGRRYTSELRLAAVDPLPFRAPLADGLASSR